jgi:hypothetical protein
MPWIAAIISTVGGGILASQQQKAAKKGYKQAAASQEEAYGRARGELSPYGDVGKSALYQLAQLQGIEGYRTPSELELTNLMANKPLPPGEVSTDGKTDLLKGVAAVGGVLSPLTAPLTMGLFGKSDKKKRAAAAAASAQYEQDLATWEAKKAELEKQRDVELQTYDPTAVLQKTPGYQFRYDTGLGAVASNQAARSNVLGGRALKELEQYGQGYASNEYANEVSRLSALAGMGQNAATTLGNLSINQGSSLANLSLGGAGANAGYYGDLNSVLQGSLGNYLTYQERQRRPQTQSPYATSYGGNIYSNPETANVFSGQDIFMNG